jgi:hypothetical protein
MFETDVPMDQVDVEVKADQFVELLIGHHQRHRNVVSGFFLVSVNQPRSSPTLTVSIVEWTRWKKKKDLKQFLIDQFALNICPFGVFSVKYHGPFCTFDFTANRLSNVLGYVYDLKTLLDDSLDAYRKDFWDRWDARTHMAKLTGIDIPSDADIFEWACTQGYDGDSLDRDVMQKQLKDNDVITPLCKQVLTMFAGVAQ